MKRRKFMPYCLFGILVFVALVSACASYGDRVPRYVTEEGSTLSEPYAPEILVPADTSESPTADKKETAGTALRSMELDSTKSMPPAPTGLLAPSPSTSAAGTAGALRRPVEASGLQAGYSDDNAQFNYYLEFLDKYSHVPHYPYAVTERLNLQLVDNSGRVVPNASVRVYAAAASQGQTKGRLLVSGTTYANGGFRLYPSALGLAASERRFVVEIESGTQRLTATIQRDGPRQVELRLGAPRNLQQPLPLDILFIMDTTGSMGEEIARLKATIEIIYYNLASLKPAPELRFGLVLYRDVNDEYVTKTVPFTADLLAFQKELDTVSAAGGGDTPEDLQAALLDAMQAMSWNSAGIRLAFVVTDAEAHLDYGQAYTYVHAANEARARAIKIHTIGTGGLPLAGEYLLRQLAQLTDGRYIFLTYGERGESAGGKPGSVSHHTGDNYQTDKLEAIIIRFVKEEVAWLSDTAPVIDNDFFQAARIPDEDRDETLTKLFNQALANLLDYSTFRIGSDTPCAVLPIIAADSPSGLAATAEYFSARLQLSAAQSRRFRTVERDRLQDVLKELELQLSGMFSEASIGRLGDFLGAEVLISGMLHRRNDSYELFLRLVRVSTAEVLAVTRAVIDPKLGLEGGN